MNTYRYFNPNPVAAHTRDCVIRAIAAVLNINVLGFTGHVAAVIDGQIWDSWDSSNEIPTYYWGEQEGK